MATWLLTLEALDASGRPVTLRYSQGRYDDPDDNDWDPRIQQPGLYRAGLFAGDLLSAQRSGYGETTLVNLDGGLNYLADYAVDGRQMTLSLADDGQVREILSGTVSRLADGDGEVSIKLRDPVETLQQPHPAETYAGTNVLPDGLEGTEDDIAGQQKPQVFGEVRNATPVPVNTSRLIYQVSSLDDCRVTAVYDKGAVITRGADYTSLAQMQSTAPAAGQFRAFRGFFRLNASPAGEITCDAETSKPNGGDVFAGIAAARGLSVRAEDVAALNAYGRVRLYMTDATATAELLDRIAISIGGYWAFEDGETLAVGELSAPVDEGLELHPDETMNPSRSATGAGSNGLPIWRVTVNADRIETVQSDVLGSVSDERRARLKNQTRKAVGTRQATRDRHPLADEITIDSVLASLAAARSVAERLVALLGVRRDVVSIDARLLELERITVSSCYRTYSPRLGYDTGRVMMVVGNTLNARNGAITLNLWG